MKDEPWRGDPMSRIQHLEAKLSNKKQRITELEAKVADLKSKITEMQNRITALEDNRRRLSEANDALRKELSK